MPYDLVIRNGSIVDGSGAPAYRADLGITDGRIAAIGRIRENGADTIDAEGHVVTPGFVDGHTHMDAQVFWDPIGSCSCYHGVTSVVMGNCGFTLAPCREEEADLVFRNLERAEDIARESMIEGIRWRWETYPEYLDVLDALPKGINYAGYIGHSALRTYVMGERAFTEPAGEDDLARMAAIVTEAVRAGAMGFTTSRSPNHQTADHKPVASRAASWDEVRAIVGAMGETGAGMFEIAGERTGPEPDRIRDYHERLKALSVETGVPVTWGMFASRHAPELWRQYFDLLDETAEAGGRMFAQVHSRSLNVLYTFESYTPFDGWDVWRDVRALPLDEQRVKLADPTLQAKLVDIASRPSERHAARGVTLPPPDWDWLFVMDSMTARNRSLAELATERGVAPAQAFLDIALEGDLKTLFRHPINNEVDADVLAMMKHPRSVVTFSDSGAHVSQIMDSSLQTHIFSHWVREKQALTLEEAVRMVTFEPATHWGLHNRGLLRVGFAGDVTVFDPERIGPRMPEIVRDLPGGAKRFRQTANGIAATVVNGKVLLRDNAHTGAQSGRLLRGPLARA
ncbi:MAG: amidohydrolase family protein [Gammaproteobacteria bacterium]|nr:amidohydrolase family protein [Gammaproteobacteria bacterium]